MAFMQSQEPDGDRGFRRGVEIAVVLVIAILLLAFFWLLATHSGIRA
jgi:hypothetical protein